jgi:hypothetical protein
VEQSIKQGIASAKKTGDENRSGIVHALTMQNMCSSVDTEY